MYRDKIWGVARVKVCDALFLVQMGLAVLLVALTLLNVVAHESGDSWRYAPGFSAVGRDRSARSVLHEGLAFSADCRPGAAAGGNAMGRSVLCAADQPVYVAARVNP